MFLVTCYDVPAKRTSKYRKLLGRYLNAAQNSVFMGDISLTKYRKLHREIGMLKQDDDRILFIYTENRHNVGVSRWEDAGEEKDFSHKGSSIT